ncbi:hypothetical protein N7532_002908 [Penicillium argentinense]|uniref:Galactose oxidase/kelch, beta-propeller n=1 Tax=Penicillium argentinense TaxID=1131581 RepID=A0A9W9KLV5_9EURO|nr:uncharacterized protein N7532_002908 [Penicillium argentinense]KAJ5110263.1 hypothetical protein N7532_002908 [Penicillium argentinense]
MRSFSGLAWAMLAVAVDRAAAACNTWEKQINLTMCNWQGLRVNVLHDTVFLDGGLLWLMKGYEDGCGSPINDGNYQGYIYYLNLSTPFNASSDFMTVLNNKTVAGGVASNLAPNYVDGFMFSNDDEFYLYGGMLRATNVTDPPADDTVLGYEAYQYGSDASFWAPGWHAEDLPSGMTRYITNGAGASAPSENLGFYFSGMRAPDWGSFDYIGLQSNTTANTLISVDMSEMGDSKWANDTLPDYILGRSKAELVWVPVAESGILVAIGGVVDPVEFFRRTKLDDSQIANSKNISPTFMETVSVYDVKSQAWYLQNTTGDIPPQLTQFCSVLASASDGSSHNIYIYGGYDGLDYNGNPSDDVYILSLPSFKWVKAYKGTSTHSRSGHRCIKIYPDQMLVFGGQHVDTSHCLEDGVIVNFNLNSLKFQEQYDPSQWAEYQVPKILTDQIGGDSSGGATITAPSSWTNSSLEGVFDIKYTKTIATYWPYDSTSAAESNTKGHGLATWAKAVIGVLCGVFGLALIIAGIWFYRRRRRQRQESKSQTTEDPGNMEERKLMYAGGPTSPRPGPVSNSTGADTGVTHSTVQDSIGTSVSPRTVESGGDAVYEMHAFYLDSSPAELPTQYNITSSTPNTSPPLSPLRSPDSPVSLQSIAESDSGQPYQPGHYRSPSSLSNVPSVSIDDVVTGRTSYFQESFENGNLQRPRHGSEISEASASSDDRGRFSGHDTIHE